MSRTLRGEAAIVGIGETTYYKHGQSPDAEFKLAIKAVLAACDDAGISPREIDGFASYSDDRSTPNRLAAALGIPEMRFANMQWGGGGGGSAAPLGAAAAAIAGGLADCVVTFRSLAQGQFGRYGQAHTGYGAAGEFSHTIPYGLLSPPQMFAMKTMRFMHEHGVRQEAFRAIALASYAHAQNNPRAVMYGRPLDEAKYDASRWITEPFHLFDCCQENDGAAAAILVSAERARDMQRKPAYLLGAASGGAYRSDAWAHNAPDYASSNFKTTSPHLYEMAGLGPQDIDVVQSYENFTGGVLMALVEHGFCAPEEANEFFTKENLRVTGKLPLNTSGGNLAECYMHGFGLINEAVRQIRGQSVNQVSGANVAMVIGGPMVTPVSSRHPRVGECAVTAPYLKPGLPAPTPMADGLDRPFWDGLRAEQIQIQRCNDCRGWQWGPEWICHRCLSFDVGFTSVASRSHLQLAAGMAPGASGARRAGALSHRPRRTSRGRQHPDGRKSVGRSLAGGCDRHGGGSGIRAS